MSSNAATTFANGIKGRPDETFYEDHRCTDAEFELAVPDDKGGVANETVPLRNAMNEVARNAYVKDCEMGLKRWNMIIKRAGYAVQLTLPSTRFGRGIGSWAGIATDLHGTRISAEAYANVRTHHVGRDGYPSYPSRA